MTKVLLTILYLLGLLTYNFFFTQCLSFLVLTSSLYLIYIGRVGKIGVEVCVVSHSQTRNVVNFMKVD